MNYKLILQHQSMDEIMYKDMIDLECVEPFFVSEPMRSKVLYAVRRIHTSTVATKYFEPPFKTVWYKRKLFKKINNGDCIIFQIAPMIHVGKSVIKKIRKQFPDCKIVLLLVDSMHAYSKSMHFAKSYIASIDWDVILSFDQSDCEEFGFEYIGMSYYSKLDIPRDTGTSTSDLYFIGALKDENSRLSLLSAIYRMCKKNDVLCDFKILCGNNKCSEIDEEIPVLHKPIPYTKVLEEISKTNCIMELVQPGQESQTARYMEAVCYNKKLLTNNSGLKNLPFYDPDFMKIIENENDVDYQWVKRKDTVNYGYNNEFSPVRILDIIEKKLHES